jgi:hypothetical protein
MLDDVTAGCRAVSAEADGGSGGSPLPGMYAACDGAVEHTRLRARAAHEADAGAGIATS